jgi:hypothetical protein
MKSLLANSVAIIGVIGMLSGFTWLYIRKSTDPDIKGIWLILLAPLLIPVLMIKEWENVKEPSVLLIVSTIVTIGAYSVGW